jgi:hypothetical protein
MTVSIRVHSGDIAALEPTEHTEGALRNVVVAGLGFGGGGVASRKVIGDDLTFHAKDMFGNRCKIMSAAANSMAGRSACADSDSMACKVRCCVSRLVTLSASQYESNNDGAASHNDVVLPHLVGSMADGFLYADFTEDLTAAIFDCIEVEAVQGCECLDGTYELEFSLVFGGSSCFRWCVTFEYSSDAKRHRLIEQIKEQLVPIYAQLNESKEIEYEISCLKSELKTLLSSKYMPPEIQNHNYSDDIDALKSLISRRQTELDDMTSRIDQVRPVKKPHGKPNPALYGGFADVIGLLVDLGMVDDKRESEILSWASSRFMGSVIVESSETAQALYRSKVKVWSIDVIVPYIVPKTSRFDIFLRIYQPIPTYGFHVNCVTRTIPAQYCMRFVPCS